MNSYHSTANAHHEGVLLKGVRLKVIRSEKTASASAERTSKPAHDLEEEFLSGKKEGRAECMKEFATAIALFRSAKNAFDARQAEVHAMSEQHVVALAMAIARKILESELKDPARIHGIVLRALAQAAPKGAARVSLHPDDLRLLECLRGEVREAGERLPEDVILCPDASVARGGCIIESPAGKVDARIETQLALIEEALRSHNAEGGAHERSPGA